MIRAYIKTFVGEFKTEEEAEDYFLMERYNFDEDVQPVFEEIEE